MNAARPVPRPPVEALVLRSRHHRSAADKTTGRAASTRRGGGPALDLLAADPALAPRSSALICERSDMDAR
eukprot:193842-Prymnesium_polylepis.1